MPNENEKWHIDRCQPHNMYNRIIKLQMWFSMELEQNTPNEWKSFPSILLFEHWVTQSVSLLVFIFLFYLSSWKIKFVSFRNILWIQLLLLNDPYEIEWNYHIFEFIMENRKWIHSNLHCILLTQSIFCQK